MRWTRTVVAMVCLGVVALRAPAARAADTGVYAELYELVLEGDDTAPPLQATLTVYQDGTAHAVAVHAGTRAAPGALVFTVDAAGVVGVGRVEGAAGAGSFQLGGTTSFPLFAAVTTVQRDAVTPAGGMVVYNTDTARLESYENGAWQALATVAALDAVGDVVITSVGDDEVLAYDSGSGNWINQTPAEAGLAGDSHTHAVDDLSDATIAAPADDEVLAYDTGSGEWINQTSAEAGIADATHTHAGEDITSGTVAETRIDSALHRDSETKDGDAVDFDDADGNFTAANVDDALSELDDANAGGPNATDAKVDWTQLGNVPAGFADGTDDGGGGPLTVQEQDGTPSVGSVTTIKFDNGTVTDAGGGTVSVANAGGSETDPTLTDDNAVTVGDGASGGNVDLTFDGDAGTDGVLRYDAGTDSFKPQNEVEFAAGTPLSVDYTEPPDNGLGDFEDFADNDGSYPSGWTESDAPAGTRTDRPADFWVVWGSSGDGTWKYSQQRSKDVEAQAANTWTSYIIGPVYWDDARLSDSVDYYFGQHADDSGAPSTSIYARAHLQWDSTGSSWRVRGEIKDGTLETQGSWYSFAFPYAQPIWFRITTKNSGNKDCRVFMSIAPPAFGFAWFQLHSDTPGQTWGQVWSVLEMSRGTNDANLNRVWIGQIQDAGNAG